MQRVLGFFTTKAKCSEDSSFNCTESQSPTKHSKHEGPNGEGKGGASSVAFPEVKIFNVKKDEGTYEIELLGDAAGYIMLEAHAEDGYTFVKSLLKTCKDAMIRKTVKAGDILLSINEHVILDEDFSDVVMFLTVLKEGKLNRRLKFLNPQKCPLRAYTEKTLIKTKVKRDMYGFNRSLEYLVSEKKFMSGQAQVQAQRDKDWVDYLKAIGD